MQRTPKVRFRFFLPLLAAGAAAFLAGWYLAKGECLAATAAAVLFGYTAWSAWRRYQRIFTGLSEFAAAARYGDFTRHFAPNGDPALGALHEGFNDLSARFRELAREKDRHYWYLQKVLEMVGTGILSYEQESGEVALMNEPLKEMLQVPYLKNIAAFARRNNDLYEQVVSLPAGETRVVAIPIEQTARKVLLSATTFATGGRSFRIVAFQNIHDAWEESEARAWQKLLNVLTHELMNSITPITSLAETLEGSIALLKEERLPPALVEDFETGIHTIKNRSRGLARFAETYRHVNRVAQPERQRFYVRDLFEDLCRLMEPGCRQKGVELSVFLNEPSLALEADRHLVEQVVINLLLNGLEAVHGRPGAALTLSAATAAHGRVGIRVGDNGPGIPADLQEKIFIPFFSTKPGGAGIGLTLCRQLMALHRGSIHVQSEVGAGTVFLLQF
ncbi:ATP-binding protein [Paraflavisolibacter sp. H34]|uniref:sensor histidine kinase n=1 Tax=Huijunlia imazamoxiresistens TaxID=3127457 RepID=UPI00301A899E